MIDPDPGWTPEQLQEASIAELAAGRLPLQAQRRLADIGAGGAFSSTLSVDEHHAVRSVGFRPVGQVMGSCVYHVGWTGAWNCGYGGWGGGFGSAGRRGGVGWGGAGAGGLGWGGGPPGTVGGGIAGGVGGAGGWSGAQVVDAPGLRQSLLDARHRAMERMRQECAGLGGDGVVAVRLVVEPFPAGGLEFQAIGTAIRADGDVRPPRPFLSDLSGQEFALLFRSGWVPCALVLGVSVGVRHDDWRTMQQGSRWAGNQEIAGFTELVHTVRAGARDELRQDCARYGGTVAVVREMSLRLIEHECGYNENARDHVAEALIVGSALVQFGPDQRSQPPLPVVRLEDGP
jgi:uncharacterized protein YbjQ (UPF0145 family)